MTVLAGEPAVSSQAVIEALGRTEMQAAVWDETENRTSEVTFWQRNGRTILSISSGLLLISAVMVHAAISKSVWVSLGLAGDHGGPDVPLATKALFAPRADCRTVGGIA